MSHLFHFVNIGKSRVSAPPRQPPHSPSKRIDYTPTAFLLLHVSGRAMCYLTKNNNERDGKCNLILLIQLPLSPPLTGKNRGPLEFSAGTVSKGKAEISLRHGALIHI